MRNEERARQLYQNLSDTMFSGATVTEASSANADDIRHPVELTIAMDASPALQPQGTDRRMRVLLSSDVANWIIDITCKDRSYGARPLRRAIQRYIEDPLAEELIRGHLQGGEVEVYLENGHLTYRPPGEPFAAGLCRRW